MGAPKLHGPYGQHTCHPALQGGAEEQPEQRPALPLTQQKFLSVHSGLALAGHWEPRRGSDPGLDPSCQHVEEGTCNQQSGQGEGLWEPRRKTPFLSFLILLTSPDLSPDRRSLWQVGEGRKMGPYSSRLAWTLEFIIPEKDNLFPNACPIWILKDKPYSLVKDLKGRQGKEGHSRQRNNGLIFLRSMGASTGTGVQHHGQASFQGWALWLASLGSSGLKEALEEPGPEEPRAAAPSGLLLQAAPPSDSRRSTCHSGDSVLPIGGRVACGK